VVGHHKDSAFDPSAASLVASYPGAFEVASEEPAAHTSSVLEGRLVLAEVAEVAEAGEVGEVGASLPAGPGGVEGPVATVLVVGAGPLVPWTQSHLERGYPDQVTAVAAAVVAAACPQTYQACHHRTFPSVAASYRPSCLPSCPSASACPYQGASACP